MSHTRSAWSDPLVSGAAEIWRTVLVPDMVTRERRSEIMARIRSTGTQPERSLEAIVTEIAGRHGLAVEIQRADLPGRPDFVLPEIRVVLFADGCFFHGCPKHGTTPKSNTEYWKAKIERNRRRDRSQSSRLRALGFSVWRLWEHDLRGSVVERTAERLARRIEKRLKEHR